MEVRGRPVAWSEDRVQELPLFHHRTCLERRESARERLLEGDANIC